MLVPSTNFTRTALYCGTSAQVTAFAGFGWGVRGTSDDPPLSAAAPPPARAAPGRPAARKRSQSARVDGRTLPRRANAAALDSR